DRRGEAGLSRRRRDTGPPRRRARKAALGAADGAEIRGAERRRPYLGARHLGRSARSPQGHGGERPRSERGARPSRLDRALLRHDRGADRRGGGVRRGRARAPSAAVSMNGWRGRSPGRRSRGWSESLLLIATLGGLLALCGWVLAKWEGVVAAFIVALFLLA